MKGPSCELSCPADRAPPRPADRGTAGVLPLEADTAGGLQLIPLAVLSPLRVDRAEHVVAAWPVATSPGPGVAAPVTVRLLTGAGFAVSTPHGITEVPESGALPGLPAVLDGLRAMSRRLAGPWRARQQLQTPRPAQPAPP